MSSNPEEARDRPRAIVFGCAGPELSEEERRFFSAANPFGFILFRRNIENPAQTRALIDALRASVGRADAPILIDQEGGRVARLQPPHWPALPPSRAIGRLAESDPPAGLAAAKSVGRLIGAMLTDLGIDVACAPVADLLFAGAHGIIGDRAYSADPALTAALARAACEGLGDAGVIAVIKHIPGHGRAQVDSHLALPRIAASRAELSETDFAVFRAARGAPWAMVAHCVYEAFDSNHPASISPTMIHDVIRRDIGFDGALIADDIGMKALPGSLAESAAATLAAGCDLTLHCSGDLAEMKIIVPAAAPLTDMAARRLAAAARTRQSVVSFDAADERARLDSLISS